MACRRHSLAGRGKGEASSLVELHVSNTAHGLNLGLEGAEVVVVSVVAALKQVLVASVSGVLVTHPTETQRVGGGTVIVKPVTSVSSSSSHSLIPCLNLAVSCFLRILDSLGCYFRDFWVTFGDLKTFDKI